MHWSHSARSTKFQALVAAVEEEQTSVSPQLSLWETLPVESKAIFCLGNDDLPDIDRLKTFAARDNLKKHIRYPYLRRQHQDAQPIASPHPAHDHRSVEQSVPFQFSKHFY